jgi:hypothetical protein
MGYSCNYGGLSETTDGKLDISLERWEEHENFIVQITSVDKKSDFYTSEVVNGKFTVYGEGRFYWIVYCNKKEERRKKVCLR